MKWWKTVLGILLIAAAAFAMYFWNAKGREKMMALEAEKAAAEAEKEIVVDSRIAVLDSGKSYFVIPKSQIYNISSFVKVGDTVGVYSLAHINADIDNKKAGAVQSDLSLEMTNVTEYLPEKYGSYEIASITEETVEIICDISDFQVLFDANKLLFVLEGIDG